MSNGALHADPHERQPLLLAVSNSMVKLYKDLFGRGPTRARTNFAGPDVLVCTLRDTFTPAERSLRKLGEHQRLRDTRMFFQYASESEFRSTVEELTGRAVVAFVSGLDTREDVACEVFYLAPQNGDESVVAAAGDADVEEG